jgi:pimeloyl-ACP methyl ester carboxylesterase
VVLVGHGLGGEVAWRLAQQAPDRVSKLVLVNAEGLQTDAGLQPLAWQLARVPVLGRLGEWLLTRSLVRQGLATAVADPSRISATQVDRYYDMALRAGNRQALIERLRDVPPGQGVAHVQGLSLPTLLLWGARDLMVPVAAADRFAADIPGSRLVRFEALGHLPQEEDPATSVAALQRFLETPH